MIEPEKRLSLERDGYVVVRDLLPRDLVDETLAGIATLLASKFPELADNPSLIHENLRTAQKLDRAKLGVVYDGIRKLAPFWSLVGSQALSHAAKTLLGTKTVGVAFKSSGIRIDLPDEDRWRCDWHQEYPAQMISPRGIVAWFPLVSVDASMGPVRVAEGSHREGLVPVECEDPLNTRHDYTRAMRIPDVEEIVKRYPEAAPATDPGDVVFLDFMTLHASGWNRSPRTRIACQVRYVDLTHADAVKNGWKGGMHEGGDFAKTHPDKVCSPRSAPFAGVDR